MLLGSESTDFLTQIIENFIFNYSNDSLFNIEANFKASSFILGILLLAIVFTFIAALNIFIYFYTFSKPRGCIPHNFASLSI